LRKVAREYKNLTKGFKTDNFTWNNGLFPLTQSKASYIIFFKDNKANLQLGDFSEMNRNFLKSLGFEDTTDKEAITKVKTIPAKNTIDTGKLILKGSEYSLQYIRKVADELYVAQKDKDDSLELPISRTKKDLLVKLIPLMESADLTNNSNLTITLRGMLAEWGVGVIQPVKENCESNKGGYFLNKEGKQIVTQKYSKRKRTTKPKRKRTTQVKDTIEKTYTIRKKYTRLA
jgi:hypothetical protein